MDDATWTYTPNQSKPLKISRSRLQMFLDCPRCFWLLMRLNIKRPSTPEFTLNKAVDTLLKKEFDLDRQAAKVPTLLKKAKLNFVPFIHDDLEDWRNPFLGLRYLVDEYNFLIFGAVDDIWLDKKDDSLMIVDYKATAKDEPLTELYAKGSYHDIYRRQVEVYQWLLQKNGFKVSPKAYFVYTFASQDKDKFANKLEFQTSLIEYEGQTAWIDKTLKDVKTCLDGDIPTVKSFKKEAKNQKYLDCDFCNYIFQRLKATKTLKKT